jgi:hypothetical protein
MISLRNRGSAYARVYLVAIDQLISSVSNFVILWIFLANFSTKDFGIFSFSWGVIALFIALSRAMFGLPSLLDSYKESHDKSDFSQTSITGAFIIGLGAMITTLIISLISGNNVQMPWMIGLCFLAPMILIHDQFRFVSIATQKPHLAILIDAILCALVLAVLIVSFRFDFLGLYAIVGLGLGYVIAFVFFANSMTVRFNFKSTFLVVRDDISRRAKLLSDAMLVFLFGIASLVLLKIATGDTGVGTYNGLIVLFGPVTLVYVFLTFGLQSEVSRTLGSISRIHKIMLFSLSLTPLLWMGIVNSLEFDLLFSLLGNSTGSIMELADVYAVVAVLILNQEVLNLFMRSREKFGAITSIRLTTGALSLFILILGIIHDLSLRFLIIGLWIPTGIGIFLTLIVLQRNTTSISK